MGERPDLSDAECKKVEELLLAHSEFFSVMHRYKKMSFGISAQTWSDDDGAGKGLGRSGRRRAFFTLPTVEDAAQFVADVTKIISEITDEDVKNRPANNTKKPHPTFSGRPKLSTVSAENYKRSTHLGYSVPANSFIEAKTNDISVDLDHIELDESHRSFKRLVRAYDTYFERDPSGLMARMGLKKGTVNSQEHPKPAEFSDVGSDLSDTSRFNFTTHEDYQTQLLAEKIAKQLTSKER